MKGVYCIAAKYWGRAMRFDSVNIGYYDASEDKKLVARKNIQGSVSVAWGSGKQQEWLYADQAIRPWSFPSIKDTHV